MSEHKAAGSIISTRTPVAGDIVLIDRTTRAVLVFTGNGWATCAASGVTVKVRTSRLTCPFTPYPIIGEKTLGPVWIADTAGIPRATDADLVTRVAALDAAYRYLAAEPEAAEGIASYLAGLGYDLCEHPPLDRALDAEQGALAA